MINSNLKVVKKNHHDIALLECGIIAMLNTNCLLSLFAFFTGK